MSNEAQTNSHVKTQTHCDLREKGRLSDCTHVLPSAKQKIRGIEIFLLSLLFAVTAHAKAIYSAQSLEAPSPFVGFYTASLTDDGLIPGYARKLATPYIQPTVWRADSGQIQFLTQVSSELGIAESVRSDGAFVGLIRILDDVNDAARPAIFQNGSRRLLPIPGERGVANLASKNVIVGQAVDIDATRTDIAVWENEQFLGLISDLPGDFRTPVAINQAGRYVGVYSGLDGYGGFFGEGMNARALSLENFPQPRALGINDDNTINGIYLPDGQTRVGYVAREDAGGNYTATKLLPLPGEVESPVWAINNAGDMVGLSTTSVNGPETATIYYAGSTTPIDMNTLIDPIPNVKLVRGIDINNHGQILVEGETPLGYRYYVLTPIPEPAHLASLVVVGFLLKRNRRN